MDDGPGEGNGAGGQTDVRTIQAQYEISLTLWLSSNKNETVKKITNNNSGSNTSDKTYILDL